MNLFKISALSILLMFSLNGYCCKKDINIQNWSFCSTFDQEDYDQLTFDCDNIKTGQFCYYINAPSFYLGKYSNNVPCKKGYILVFMAQKDFVNGTDLSDFGVYCIEDFDKKYKEANE